MTASPNNTTVTPTSGNSITDSVNEVWTLVSSGGGQAAVNGVTDTTTANVIELVYSNGLVYQQNASGGWWYKAQAANPWTATVSPAITTPTPSTPTPSPAPSGTLTNWWQNPGQDGGFWKQPFYTSAQWITSGSEITTLRNGNNGSPTAVVNVPGNFATPFYIGKATDPLVSVTETGSGKTINVRIPVGAVVETPETGYDSSIGGTDMTQPYLVWTASNATINTGSIQASGSSITCTYGLAVDDGAGNFMCDAVTGQPGTGNAYGLIQDADLTNALADPEWVIPHMLAYTLDPSMVNAATAIWPLLVVDTSAPTTGAITQGYTIGIPQSVARPPGQTRGFYLLWDSLQQYGWFFYNVAGAGCLTISCYSILSQNAALFQDVQNSISAVIAQACILSNQSGPSSVKGYVSGATPAYPPPPLLDLSPTGGVNISPSKFGAWYPSNYAPTGTAPDGSTIGYNIIPPTPVYPSSPSPTPSPPSPVPSPSPPSPPSPTPVIPSPVPSPPTPVPSPAPSTTNYALQTAYWTAMTTALAANADILMGVAIRTGDPQGASGVPDEGLLGTPSAPIVQSLLSSDF